MDDIIRGMSSTLAEKEDNIVVPDLRGNRGGGFLLYFVTVCEYLYHPFTLTFGYNTVSKALTTMYLEV